MEHMKMNALEYVDRYSNAQTLLGGFVILYN